MKKFLCTLSALVLISIAVNAQRAINNNLRWQKIERLQEEKRLRRLYITNRRIRTQHLPAKNQQQSNNAPVKDSTINKKSS